ncbi:hypothetical protein FRC10_005163 [Ceratobasidium sp. 414]|nr:hypothetical protein FRC10_005163 [Ceratobasidium sp. 414]
MTHSPPDASATTRPPLVRRTYGKKRYLMDREELGAERVELPTKKSRLVASPTKGDNRPDSNTQTPLKRVPVNAPPHRLDPPPSSRLASPTKLAHRGTQDQNALDSPFLEPRKPSRPPGLGLGYTSRRVSSTKLNPHTRLRHLSLNQSGSNNKAHVAKETPIETLRRKTSEATTALGTSLTEHSWLVPPPPRLLVPKRDLPANPDSRMFDFSFNPPAESTFARVSRPARTPPAGTAEDPLIILGSDGTPTARRPSLQDEIAAAHPRKDMGRHRKRHDSILSTDSEDFGTTFSIFGLTPKPRLVAAPSQDPDATPRNPSLIEQLCGPRSRSGSITVRPLSHDIPLSVPLPHPSSDADDEGKAPAATGAVPCADMGKPALSSLNDLGGDSSPSRLIKAASKQTKGRRNVGESKYKLMPPPTSSPTVQGTRHSGKPYQLSPRAVHHLSQRRRVGMRIEDRPLSPNDDVDMFASYEFDRGMVKDAGN